MHLADIHIGMENYGRLDPATGLNGRVMDFLRRLSEAVDYALENEVDLVLFAGDAYKTRDPNSTYRREFARRIKRLADAGISVVLLVGNHDLPAQERRASSIDIFRTLDVPNVLVGNRDLLHRIATRRGAPIQVATVPYPVRQRLLSQDEHKGKTMSGAAVGLVSTGVGLACAAIGLYGVIDSVRFGRGAVHATAIVVGVAEAEVGLLEFVASGRRYRVPARGVWGVRWAATTGRGVRCSIHYPPERPHEARLSGFDHRFGIPLILLGLGCMFIPAGVSNQIRSSS